jgi:hypothetical protein
MGEERRLVHVALGKVEPGGNGGGHEVLKAMAGPAVNRRLCLFVSLLPFLFGSLFLSLLGSLLASLFRRVSCLSTI